KLWQSYKRQTRSTSLTAFKPPVDTSPSTSVYLCLPSVYLGRRTCTTTCRHMSVYLRLPPSTSGYLKWTAFGYLRLPPSTSVCVGPQKRANERETWEVPRSLDKFKESQRRTSQRLGGNAPSESRHRQTYAYTLTAVAIGSKNLQHLCLPRPGSVYSHLLGRQTEDSGELDRPSVYGGLERSVCMPFFSLRRTAKSSRINRALSERGNRPEDIPFYICIQRTSPNAQMPERLASIFSEPAAKNLSKGHALVLLVHEAVESISIEAQTGLGDVPGEMAGMGCNACNRGEGGGDERWKIGNISGGTGGAGGAGIRGGKGGTGQGPRIQFLGGSQVLGGSPYAENSARSERLQGIKYVHGQTPSTVAFLAASQVAIRSSSRYSRPSDLGLFSGKTPKAGGYASAMLNHSKRGPKASIEHTKDKNRLKELVSAAAKDCIGVSGFKRCPRSAIHGPVGEIHREPESGRRVRVAVLEYYRGLRSADSVGAAEIKY
ncbi:hypothetical protein DFH08DRAFT_1046321, partial [Mycena albidolilacea]